jgi:hypothetical protein
LKFRAGFHFPQILLVANATACFSVRKGMRIILPGYPRSKSLLTRRNAASRSGTSDACETKSTWTPHVLVDFVSATNEVPGNDIPGESVHPYTSLANLSLHIPTKFPSQISRSRFIANFRQGVSAMRNPLLSCCVPKERDLGLLQDCAPQESLIATCWCR